MGLVIGIDIGGTFTDAFAASEDGHVYSAKTHSTPPDFSRGLINVLNDLAKVIGLSVAEMLGNTLYICHGTTAALNAVVTGNVAKVGFLTTAGHADSLRIMNVEGRYAGLGPEQIQDIISTRKPAPLLSRKLVREIDERVDSSGSVVLSLNEATARASINELVEQGVEAIAISLLWSFKNPAHETRLRELVREIAPDLHVSISSEICPKIREYPRNVTTVVSAQVGPKLKTYLRPLDNELREMGLTGSFLVMQGAGGAVTALDAPEQAATTIGSVLTGGVVGCAKLGELRGDANIISTDMGGTTFLVGLVVDCEPVKSTHTILNQYSIATPMVDIATIGSGGGAIASLDAGGNLRVGPNSAGARPGPACYGEGGTEPTITDANVVLGILNPDNFLGGKKKLDKKLAEDAIRTRIAEPLGLSVEQAAIAIFTIANDQTAQLIRQSVVNKGYDPRDFIVYAFGGAAPVHCGYYSADMGVKGVLVPLGSTASTFSAYGLASSDIVLTAETSNPNTWPVDARGMQGDFERLEQTLDDRLNRQKVPFVGKTFRREVDLRYTMQIAEVETPVPAGALTESSMQDIADAFEDIYERRFGRGTGFREAGMQSISYRVYATGHMPVKATLPPARECSSELKPTSFRNAMLDSERGWEKVAVYTESDFETGHEVVGPCIVEAATTTIVVPAGMHGSIDRLGNLVMTYE